MSVPGYTESLSLDLSIRPLGEADIPAVLDIECRSYSHPWKQSVFLDCFHSNYRLWALEDAGRLVGYAVVCYQFDEAHLLNICVSPACQRRGLGRHLLRHVVAESIRDGMIAIILEVRAGNEQAARLYLSEGFTEIGLRAGYYPAGSGREDARVMSLALGAS